MAVGALFVPVQEPANDRAGAHRVSASRSSAPRRRR
jgi:hypothetical protein